jgi:hypothetical protein
VLEWLEAHSELLLAISTFVLVAATAWLAWTTRSLVQESHLALRASARATLQARLDRISELCIAHPELFALLDDPSSTGEEQDSRFHLANMFLGLLEEAHMQYNLEHAMNAEDWNAWEATADVFLPKEYVRRYWLRVSNTFDPGFRHFVDSRIRLQEQA